jgi:hypothetical protein
MDDGQRRRPAAKAKKLGRRILHEVATMVTPETLWAWHPKPIARKWEQTPWSRPPPNPRRD